MTDFEQCTLVGNTVCHFKLEHLIADKILFRVVSCPLPWKLAVFKMVAAPSA